MDQVAVRRPLAETKQHQMVQKTLAETQLAVAAQHTQPAQDASQAQAAKDTRVHAHMNGVHQVQATATSLPEIIVSFILWIVFSFNQGYK